MRSNVAQYELVAPGSLDAVLALLAAEPGAWTPMAGGTELMVALGAGRLEQRKLVSLWGINELRQITANDDWLTIGAAATFSDIRENAVVAKEFPLLARAASWTGAIANQNRGTLGGNIVNASPAADSPPVLLDYEAEIELVSAQGERRMPYSEFHLGYKRTVLKPQELVKAVHLPRGRRLPVEYLRKVGTRNALAISKVALACVGAMQSGKVHVVRIAAASLRETPARLSATEAALLGHALTSERIQFARQALLQEVKPIDDIRSTANYRAHVAANLLEEFLEQMAASDSKTRP
ncbi:MAG: FAD binding domain-containing protein [Terracidiphilus sp.]|jgi:CO/xanthine dehydrogenase FAD-binding subunit